MQQRILMLLLGLALLVVAGCGFHLRGTTQIPHELRTLLLESSDPYGPLTRAVRQQLRLNKVHISDDSGRQDLPSLRIISSTQRQNTVSLFQDGKTAEYQLQLDVQAQVLIPGQDIWPLHIIVYRSFFDNPLAALAKSAEGDIIGQEMREQAARQLVRQLLVLPACNPCHDKKTAKNRL